MSDQLVPRASDVNVDRLRAAGSFLAACRRQVGVTQREVARRAALCECSVRSMERGRNRHRLSAWRRVAAALGDPGVADDLAVLLGPDGTAPEGHHEGRPYQRSARKANPQAWAARPEAVAARHLAFAAVLAAVPEVTAGELLTRAEAAAVDLGRLVDAEGPALAVRDLGRAVTLLLAASIERERAVLPGCSTS